MADFFLLRSVLSERIFAFLRVRPGKIIKLSATQIEENLLRRFKRKALTGFVVEQLNDKSDILLIDLTEICSLGKKESYVPVYILARSSLPRTVLSAKYTFMPYLCCIAL